MLVLTIRTDQPDAEIGLYEDTAQVAYEVWYAHRELSVTILGKIAALLRTHHKSFQDIQGIVGFAGPGSFTGLRIGLTVANTLAYGLNIPVAGIAGEDDWIQKGSARLQAKEADQVALPFYGREPTITVQKK